MAEAEGRGVSIERVMASFDDRGYALALFFLAFPFVLPIPSLGMSAPATSASARRAPGVRRW